LSALQTKNVTESKGYPKTQLNKGVDMPEALQTLINQVQKNCHIADARHAGDYTLCVYLLKMRELYRWEQQISFQQVLTSDDVGDWLTEREDIWDEMEEANYFSLTWNGHKYDAFEGSDEINQQLNQQSLVYSAGYGNRCRPHFFIAELERKAEQAVNGVAFTIYEAGRELARDMAAPPAMAQGNRIFIRKESFRRMLWEKVEEWRWNPVDNALGRAIKCYDFEQNIELALDSMMQTELEMVIAHEIGEVLASEQLGSNWEKMLNTLPRSTAEIMLRAIKDHLADVLYALSLLLEKQQVASIHFYFGNLTAMRKKLAPKLVEAYNHWHQTGSVDALQSYLEQANAHWYELALESLMLFEEQGAEAATAIEQQVESRIYT
jgi:hypothetical protein